MRDFMACRNNSESKVAMIDVLFETKQLLHVAIHSQVSDSYNIHALLNCSCLCLLWPTTSFLTPSCYSIKNVPFILLISFWLFLSFNLQI